MAKQTFTVGQVLTAAQLTSLQQTAMLGGAASAKTASYTLVAADAGTTISMTSTSATTITVNTGLFAAGDTVFIQNLGTGNLTITAGTATVSTAGSLILPQNDAGILYFVSTGVSVFYDFIQVGAASPLTTKGDLYGFSTLDARVPIGANGTVLTADSTESLGLKWATPSSGGGMTLLSTTNLSGSNSVSVSGISTAYQNLFVIWGGATFSGTEEVGVDIIANGNLEGVVITEVTGTVSTNGNQNSFVRTNNQISGTGGNNAGALTVYDYASTTRYKLFNYVAGSATQASISGGIVENNAAVTVITVFTLTGATFTGGTVRIYGVS